MVGPASDDEKRAGMARLRFGVVVLVGASAGLITMSGGGSLLEVGVAVVAGLAVGAALFAYLVHIA